MTVWVPGCNENLFYAIARKFEIFIKFLVFLEVNFYWRTTVRGEIEISKRIFMVKIRNFLTWSLHGHRRSDSLRSTCLTQWHHGRITEWSHIPTHAESIAVTPTILARLTGRHLHPNTELSEHDESKTLASHNVDASQAWYSACI